MPSFQLCFALVVAFLLSPEIRALDGLGGAGGGKSSSKSRRLSDFTYRQQRGLETADKLMEDTELLDKCGDTDYGAFLFVDEHIYAVAFPGSDAQAAGCPMLVAHAVFESEHRAGNKELLQWNDVTVGEYLFPQDESLSMGTFKLSELWRAYHDADVNASGYAVYDIVTNNCGAFVVNLASELDMPIDTRVTTFVVRRLLQNSSKELYQRVRQSVSYLDLYGNRRRRRAETVTDEELINLLVDYQTSKVH